MGVSTNGQICFGIKLAEGDYPWTDYDGDIDDWWIEEINGYQPPFEMFDETGNWIAGMPWPDDKVSEYFKHRREFANTYKLPVQLVNVCSGDYPEYILAIPESIMVARRGYPEIIDVNKLAHHTEWEDALLAFVDKHNLETEGDCNWYLSSYWG